MDDAKGAVDKAAADFEAAGVAQTAAAKTSEDAEAALVAADEARAEAQSREADARAARSSAEGEVNALHAEVQALSRLVNAMRSEGSQVLDALRVKSGYGESLGRRIGRRPACPRDRGRSTLGVGITAGLFASAVPARRRECPVELCPPSPRFWPAG